MDNWQTDVLTGMEGSRGELECFNKIAASVKSLGFEDCTYGLRIPIPVMTPVSTVLTTHSREWLAYYMRIGYLDRDKRVSHCLRTREPLLWTDMVFAQDEHLWGMSQTMGLRVGWAQSSLDANGVAGMLSLSRPHDALSGTEIASIKSKINWLVNTAHYAMSNINLEKIRENICLTQREIEVLKWTADGKTSEEISIILSLSVNTVNFHIKNAVAKLKTKNKTSAVVLAAMLGMLY